MKYPLPRLFLLTAAIAAGAVAAEPASLADRRPTSVDFEAVPEGPLSGVPGWAVESGRAVVTAVDSGRALRLPASSPECAVVAQAPACRVGCVSFTVRGLVAAPRAESMEFANIAGALIAFVAEAPGCARFWVLDCGGCDPEWKAGSATVATDAYGVLAGATRVSVVMAADGCHWSLVVGDEPARSTYGLLNDAALGGAHRFYGFDSFDWWLDDYGLIEGGAVQVDATSGGGATRELGASVYSGFTPTTNSSRYAVAASVQSDCSAVESASSTVRIYVSASLGADANDGRSPARPKATLLAACEALPAGRGQVIVSEGAYRQVIRRFPFVVFVFNGDVVVK